MAITLAGISKHLSKDIIEKIFNFKTNDKAKNIEVERAAPAGQGLLGAVYRITVIGEKSRSSFIVKGLVTDTLVRKSLNCAKYFKREAFFYSKILPTLLELENESRAQHSIQKQVPTCYGCLLDGENDFIILEDLSAMNCVVLSSTPTRSQRDASLNVLAHIHAVSKALRIKKPKEFTRIVNALPEIYFNEENRDWYCRYLQNAIEIDKTVINEYEDPKSIYYKKFYELIDNDVYSKFIEAVSTRNENSVLNHGDAWYPNFLYSKDRAFAIDFQLVRCASPVTDLAVFVLLCGDCKTKEDFFEAIDVYYKSLEFYLEDLGLNANKYFSKDLLWEEMKCYGKCGLLASLTTIPLMASKRCDVLSSFEGKYSDTENIPLEFLWRLTPLDDEGEKLRLINAIRVSVDVGLI